MGVCSCRCVYPCVVEGFPHAPSRMRGYSCRPVLNPLGDQGPRLDSQVKVTLTGKSHLSTNRLSDYFTSHHEGLEQTVN
ncbi:hypothetical protein RRG08_025450 [Elysia crispata]|uniref:Uncharacterized protein n=1 Tax=Elysia crispata TaxID=231223 RepID=A0AAE1CWT5_9GAST|nr:hypothetical protein RRG08_025450 [Elysia crispata]